LSGSPAARTQFVSVDFPLALNASAFPFRRSGLIDLEERGFNPSWRKEASLSPDGASAVERITGEDYQ
jgi:hypothetical protein